MADYTTTTSVKVDLDVGGLSMGTSADVFLSNAITEASRLIDSYKRVEGDAYANNSEETRYYDGTGQIRQPIDYASVINAVAVEETDGTYTTWSEDTDFFFFPENHDTIGEPIRWLIVNQKSDGNKSVWTHGQRRVKVVGKFGISTSAPAEVARACKIQVQRWFKRAQQGWADSSASPELGQVLFTRELDPDVKTILDSAFPHRTRGI